MVDFTSLTGIKDIDFQILNNLDDPSLLYFCKVNRKVSQLCQDPELWQRRLKERYPEMVEIKPIFPASYLSALQINNKGSKNLRFLGSGE